MPAPPRFAGIWREDERARAAYSEGAGPFRIVPAAVAVPSTTAALAELVRWARAERCALVPRGAGSGMPGGNVGPGVIVDLTALDGAPLQVDPERRTARTGAATTLGDLDEAARRHGLRMPVDPSSARWVTSGGAVSTNAAGPRSVKYGPVRRWVRGLSIVSADGELLHLERGVPPPSSAVTRRFAESIESTLRLARWRAASSFPKVRKNTAGYALDAYLASGDLLDLVIGAEGTLGLVVDVTWRLGPAPVARAGVRAAVRDVRRLSHCVPALLSLDPARLEFLDGSFLEFVGPAAAGVPSAERLIGSGALLMVEFEGASSDDLTREVERAVGILKPESHEVLVASDDRETDALWAIRRAASSRLAQLGESRRSLQLIEDGCVPLDRLGDYLVAVRRAAADRNVPVVLFGHAGDGNVHANLLPDLQRPDWRSAVSDVFADVSREVIAMGGTPSGEHGDGRLRSGLLERLYGWEMAQLFRQLKRTFDPDGVLNPGVKIPADGDPLAGLKVGGDAAPIPADIDGGLRWIERHAGYAVARLSLADDPSSRAAAGPV